MTHSFKSVKSFLKKATLLGLIFIGFICEAQIKRISFNAGINRPLIDDLTYVEDLVQPSVPFGVPEPTAQTPIKHSFNEKTGFQFGGNIDMTISKKIFLTTGLSFSNLRFKKEVSLADSETRISGGYNDPVFIPLGSFYGHFTRRGYNDLSGSRIQLASSDNLGETSVLYLQFPLLMGTSLLNNKLLIRAGGNLSLLMSASEYKLTSQLAQHEHKDTSKDSFTKALASASVNVTYMVWRKIGVDVSAIRSLNSIYKANKANGTFISLGISYFVKH